MTDSDQNEEAAITETGPQVTAGSQSPGYDTWRIVNTSLSDAALAQFGSVCAISNGYLGLRGKVAEDRDGQQPGTLIHGVFDELDMFGQIRPTRETPPQLDPRYFDTAGPSPAIANLPDPLFVRTFIDDREISLARGGIEDFQQVLDLTNGVYRYSFDHHDGLGRTTRVAMERFACLRHAHRVFMRYTLTPTNHDDTPIRVHTGIDGDVRSNVNGERQFRVNNAWCEPAEVCRLAAQTRARQHSVDAVVRNKPTRGQPDSRPVGVAEHNRAYTRYAFTARRGRAIVIERYIVLSSSEDLRHRTMIDAGRELAAMAEQGFAASLIEQEAAWSELWQQCDVQLEGDPPAQLGLRFCIHQLLAAAPRFGDRLSVPVKLLTGEFYQGSVFHDTDLYIVPFLAWTQPELARTCLNFRHEGLRTALEIARGFGHQGARFPWQAGPLGEECLGKWWRSTQTGIHVTAAVAYALMQYVRATGDAAYLHTRGAEMLVEAARLFASRAAYNAPTESHELRDVTGPDEGHVGVANDFHTNYMAAWTLRQAADVLGAIAGDDPTAHASLTRRLGIAPDETAHWRHVADGLPLLQDGKTRVFEQFAGFFNLKPMPADLLDDRKAPFVSAAPYQASHQPDVLLTLSLFRDEFDADTRQANWSFYNERCLDFSSTSYAPQSIVAADLGDMEAAYRDFIITTGLDLDEGLTRRRDTRNGLHGTACAGAWHAAVLGFGGVRLATNGLHIDPRLPKEWKSLRFKLAYQGKTLNVAIDADHVTVSTDPDASGAATVVVIGQIVKLQPGETHRVPRNVSMATEQAGRRR